MLKKLILVLIVLCISIGTWYLIQHRTALKTISPTGEYSVILRDDLISPILFETLVKFEVTKGGNEFLDATYLNGWDGHNDFLERFPSHKWIGDSALLFESGGFSDSGKSGVMIVNESGRDLKYLRFTAQDILLVFDLIPNQQIKFATRAREHNKWFQLDGAFSDDTVIERDFNFSGDDRVLGLNSCSVIKILDNDINISADSVNVCGN